MHITDQGARKQRFYDRSLSVPCAFIFQAPVQQKLWKWKVRKHKATWRESRLPLSSALVGSLLRTFEGGRSQTQTRFSLYRLCAEIVLDICEGSRVTCLWVSAQATERTGDGCYRCVSVFLWKVLLRKSFDSKTSCSTRACVQIYTEDQLSWTMDLDTVYISYSF